MKYQKSESIYQIKIKLLNFKPWIWRRVLVPGQMNLGDLHRIIQRVMPWDGGHLHQFAIDGEEYGPVLKGIDADGWGTEVLNEEKYTLARVVPFAKQKFKYEYDFGDDWVHDVVVEKLLEKNSDLIYPFCIGGENAAPPDDCGGVWGYAELIEILKNPKHTEYERMTEWIGGEFDSQKFDLDHVNQSLRSLFGKRKTTKVKTKSRQAILET